jgi:hypothetical protein
MYSATAEYKRDTSARELQRERLRFAKLPSRRCAQFVPMEIGLAGPIEKTKSRSRAVQNWHTRKKSANTAISR